MPADDRTNAGASKTPNRPGTVGRNPTGDRPADGSLSKDFRVQAPAVSLPKGGGAISGIGEKFSANPVTGTAGLSLPLPISPGRGGAGPALSLSYDSGAGNGPFGLGWRLGVASVRRKTDKGLPRYRDSGADADTYVLSDAEDLVPLLVQSGETWGTSVRTAVPYRGDDYTVQRYRPRVEGGFALIERWTRDSDKRIHWRTIGRDNTRRLYGYSDQARLVDPDRDTRVFEWLLEEERDERGNIVSYQYIAEDRANVERTPAEAQRASAGSQVAYRYLKRVSYANTEVDHNPDLEEGGEFKLHLVFDYGDHDTDDPALERTVGAWPARADAHSNFRSGFDVRCYRLCQRVLMFHSFTALRSETVDAVEVPVPVVVRALNLTYTERSTATTLDQAQVAGWRWGGTSYTTATLPPLTLSYATPEIDETVQLVSGLDDLPSGLDTRIWSWVDLDGEGLTGLLTDQGAHWVYKRNEGDGRFGAAQILRERPNLDLGGAGVRLVDLDGDGNLDAVVIRPGIAGSYAREDGAWAPMRKMAQVPSVSLSDPDARLIDLDGDGHADLLVSENDVYTWYPSEARDGFGAGRRVPMAVDEAQGPRLVFSRQGEQIFLADMTGDGLTDLVRVRNGNICYWPNRGHGRFGARVQMSGAPLFDRPDRFDPARIRLADVDGSGPTDLLYIGADGVRIWYNQSGNSFSAPTTLSRLPSLARPNDVQVTDLRGDGTACLVWSSPLLSQSWRPLRYVQLMANGKPWLLTSYTNGLGAEVRLSYTASTAYYLADRRAGTPWATRLPFPVHCLSEVTHLDHVTGWRLVQRYAYHHGTFDGAEREFRGFGMVEQWDTESSSNFENTEIAADADVITVDTVRTRTWFHTGVWRLDATLTDAFEAEYSAIDSQRSWTSAPFMPAGLDPDTLCQAHRALKGRPLRVEVYAEDGDGALVRLYTTSHTTYNVVLLQPVNGEDPASFRIDPAETLSYAYDQDLSSETYDPRASQTLVLAVDDYGTVTRSAAISFPRRSATEAAQQTLRVLVTETEVKHQDDRVSTDDIWHIGVPVRAKVWELTGTDAWTDSSRPDADAVDTVWGESEANILAFEETPSGTTPERRLLGHQISVYYDDDTVTVLDPGALGLRALLASRYALALTSGLLTSVYDTDVDSTKLTEAGYVDLLEDGDAWLPSGSLSLDPALFYQPVAYLDPWSNTTDLAWDDDALVMTGATDPLGLETTAVIDYHTLAPTQVTDPSGTVTVATLDALGRVTGTAVSNGTDGDQDAEVSAEYTYETDRWYDPEPESVPLPARVYMRMREVYGEDTWLTSYAYSNGGGKVIQTVTEAEPDAATPTTPRWVVSGRVEIDNKGNIIRQYEPFYTDDVEFDFTAEGVSALLVFDPIGRNTRMELPDGNVRTWTYNPWVVSAADECDNETAGTHTDTPSETHLDAQGRVYKVVETPDGATFYNTKLTLDVMGNPTAVEDPRTNTIQEQIFDLLGRPMWTGAADEGYDPDAPTTDKGQTRVLLDVTSKPVWMWRSGGISSHQRYDVGRRPVALYVDEGSGERAVNVTFYGDAVSDAAATDFARGRPLQVYDTAGRVVFVYDFRGRTLSQTRTLHELIETEADWDGLVDLLDLTDPDVRPLLADIDSWLSPSGGLSTTESFEVSSTYDALDRPTEQVTPDLSRTVPGYDAGGKLKTVAVYVRGAEDPTPIVTDITYNARGQRETITYANHTTTTTTYDPSRFWPTQIVTERSAASAHGAATVQDLNYTHDAVGNITQITDLAQETLYFANTQVTATRAFTYDDLYRLVSATGREKSGLVQATPKWSDCGGATGGLPDTGDGESGTSPVLRRYTEVYTYDAAGNLTEVKHQNGTGGTVLWKRGYRVADQCNQLERTSIATDDYALPDSYSDEYTYNDRGAMTAMPHLSSTATENLVRDFRDQIRRVYVDDAGTEAWYAYDAAGQRVRKVIVKTSVVEERIYLGSYEVWRRKNTSGDIDEERETLHVLDGQRRAALIETLTWEGGDELDEEDVETRIRYQLDDHLGTATVELDEDGGTISYEEYHPYGTTAWYADDGTLEGSPKRYRYTGMERDEETGLQYHSARYYAPWLGRWCSADPIGLGDGVNRHGYVRGRPVHRCDLSGCQDPEAEPSILSTEYWSGIYAYWAEGQYADDLGSWFSDLTPLAPVSEITIRALNGEEVTQDDVDAAKAQALSNAGNGILTVVSLAGSGIVMPDPSDVVRFSGARRAMGSAAFEDAQRLSARGLTIEGSAVTRGVRLIQKGAKNASGVVRSTDEAIKLAEGMGALPDADEFTIMLIPDESLRNSGTYAEYLAPRTFVDDSAGRAALASKRYTRDDFFINPSGEQYIARVRIDPSILESDEMIVNILAHESLELQELFSLTEGGRWISGTEMFHMLSPSGGNTLHNAAVDYGNSMMREYVQLRAAGGG